MSKEYIEEMNKDLSSAPVGGLKEDLTPRTMGEKYYISYIRDISKHLIDAGWCKQKEGFWNYIEECNCFACSVCGNSALNNYRGLSVSSNFCPHCGARMKGE